MISVKGCDVSLFP